jgi:hypothetical protein
VRAEREVGGWLWTGRDPANIASRQPRRDLSPITRVEVARVVGSAVQAA